MRTAVIAVVAALALAWGSAAQAQTVLKYATQLPKTHHLTKADYRFAELANEKSGGRLKVEVYPAGQLYAGPSLVKAVTSGAIEMGIVYGGAWTGPLPLIDLFDIPFLFGDYGAVQRALKGRIGELLRTELDKRGVRVLSWGAYGESFSLASNKRPLRVPKDFEGMKLRANQPMAAAALKALGASAVMMSAAEVYVALQRGTVDGASSGPSTIAQRKWFEVTKYTTLANASYSIWPVMINAKAWSALSPDLRKVLEEAGAAHEAMTFANAAREDDESIKLLRERQEAVHVLTAEERGEWTKRMDAVRAEWLSRTGKEGADVLKWVTEGR
jgi:tripartite ATP-independent transporter DctP family solute receptor